MSFIECCFYVTIVILVLIKHVAKQCMSLKKKLFSTRVTWSKMKHGTVTLILS